MAWGVVAGELIAGFLKVPMVAIVVLLDLCFPARTMRPRWRSGGRRQSTAYPLAGRSVSGQPSEFLASRGMPARPAGEESLTDAIASQAIEAQPSFGQITPLRGRVVRASNSILGRRRGGRRVLPARGRAFQAKEKKPWRTERMASGPHHPRERQRRPKVSLSA